MPPPKLSPLAGRLLDSGLGTATIDAPEPAAAPALAARKRSKLWELADKYHCPVIGTCIQVSELQNLARRFKFTACLRDEFALHTEAVGWSRSRNEVSEALQRLLDRKYENWVARFAKLKSDAEVHQLWQECLGRGEVAGPFWAALSHKASEAETRQLVYADIHMLSHQVGAGQAADSRRLGHLEKENAALRLGLEEERAQHARQVAELQSRLAEMESRLLESQAIADEAEKLRRRLGQFESGQAMVEMGQRLTTLQIANEQLRIAAQRAGELDRALQASRDEAGRLARERDSLGAEREALERLLLAAAGPDAEDCSGDCSGCAGRGVGAAQRCILYVGGRTSLVNQYRKLAERLGIRLLHHDGGLEEALSRLPEMIHGADAVVCPTDCVSHSAYYHLKNHCRRVGKPCLFFRGAGVSSFAVAMTRLAGGEFSLAGAAPENPA